MPIHHQIIYQAYTARHTDGGPKWMHPDVRWPKAFEGDLVSGHDAVRAYWQLQWSEVDPRVERTGFEKRPDGTLAVTVPHSV